MNRIAGILLVLVLIPAFFREADGQKPELYKIRRLPFNSEVYSEISPVMVKDGLIFCSDRRFSGIIDRIDFNGTRLYNFYYTQPKDSNQFSRPEVMETSLSYLFNNGPFCISPDGRMIYFTSEIETGPQTKNRQFRNHSGIFYAYLSGHKIGAISPFRYNNPAYNIGQPSISSDGKFLIFASDMPGGYGGSDLYYCELVNGIWSAPRNMGPVVNSSRRENYPFSHSSGKLFFSSDRPGGKGKLDIYYTTMVSGVWQKPVLLPEPINSSSDDFAFIAGEDLAKGYFASNRASTDDIYEFTSAIERMDRCDSMKQNSYCFRFTEENAVKNDSIPFRYTWNFGDGGSETGAETEHCFAGPGRYIIQLDVVNTVTNEIMYNQRTDTLYVKDAEQPYISCPDTVKTGAPVSLSAAATNLPGWNISLYYWNFGDYTIDTGENVTKSYNIPGVYNVQLIVTGTAEDGKPARKSCVAKNILVTGSP
jgi:PKD domain/WD40-like Beta Propeller Repeat